MSLTQIIFISILLVIIAMTLLLIKIRERKYKNRISLLSIISLALILLNWVCYLIGFYAGLPVQIADIIFIPIWYVLCIAALIISLIEYKKSPILAVLNGGLSIISSIFGFLLIIIGS